MRRIACTLQLMLFALLPRARGAGAPPEGGEARLCAPGQIRGGLERFLDKEGELRLFFPDCQALAAPFILFRMKREGFSRCSVLASKDGLQVRGRR